MTKISVRLDTTSEVFEIPEENLWPVYHVIKLFAKDGLVDRKSNKSGYADSWREFGPAGMLVHCERKRKRMVREIWDQVSVTDNEPLSEVIDDDIIFKLRMSQLVNEDPSDMRGKNYRSRSSVPIEEDKIKRLERDGYSKIKGRNL